ncbi:MAG: DUF1566 domain-containing protein [Bacteroidetes bacterium]|nr:DUF1566 domain-containing protein [Bacteroidota bacterium]
MKKQILFTIFAATQLFIAVHLSAQVGINTDNSAPDPSAGLDVKFTNKGFLLPRVALTAINSADPITAPAIGLLVYNTANAGTPPNNVITGYYCWNGTQWIPVLPPQGTNVGDMLYWNGTQWIGVPVGTNGQALILDNGIPVWGGVQLPILYTMEISSVTDITATSGGTIVSDGGAAVTSRGVCWSTNTIPTIIDSHTTDGISTGVFVSDLTGLIANTIYYVRAYATNSSGTSYGNQQSFTAGQTLATLTTATIINITSNAATGGGNILSDGGASVTAHGVCWSTGTNPTIADNHSSDGIGTGTFISSLTGLTPNTSYNVRAYATNIIGTSYGNQVTFSTLADLPALTTDPVTSIAPTTATSGGNISSDGGATVTVRGVCWSTSANPTLADSHSSDGIGTGTFISNLTGLAANTFYYVRAYATNSSGISYGNQRTFSSSSFYIGQSYGGGIIFYVDGTGRRGLIADTNDLSTGAPWGCFGVSTGATGTDIGTGQANTTAIINVCSTYGIAARICDDLVLNGYDDWFLPSKDELNQLYSQKNVIGGFATNYYWSSSEDDANAAWFQHFYDGYQYYDRKDYTYCVRAVRAFGCTTQPAPIAGTNIPSLTQIVWNWNTVSEATGYKWNTTNNYSTASDMGNATTNTETGLIPDSLYTRYVWSYNICGNSTATTLSQTTLSFSIGLSYGGGIIFYIDGTGNHGLIAAPSDQSTGAQWGCYGTSIGGTGTAIGTGQANTTAIVNGCSESDIAAKICDNLVLNGYSDWFLPSKDEQNQMYSQKNVIGGFANYDYWSSSEYNASYTWAQHFSNGFQYGYGKNYTSYVRAVRVF